ncbi:pyridoxal-phosphate dependent enzyme [Natronobacterium gregoryi]|uniref:Pyridoxal-5'-phosphate-dependent protein beta subunit n=2 Tax=Natronobacterium gregoryi TaxID=44930 RepID=L0AHB5_NATGS|nr:pyridoxal-phosphate dependent enzyme [Natronobacterium gregoryi]AFZ73181.1 threonine synthase [Natronobacterium gregoryi SP2]ELY71362.1 Pyridoxal-5'-phosphate-dependent protein beta subunit [Natronobacterium gregoryi SP2]PLK21591.1 threonine synthase [Natronobacterium gregoryi SP2]SFI59211.1 L-threonine synthase [Natronobacterium gregoryi]
MASDLVCPACGTTYEAGPSEPWRCGCERALEFVEQPLPTGDPLAASQLDSSDGLWAFSEFLPIEQRVTFHEGFTPLVDAPDWDAQFKLEYVFPTGSFKDRGATTTLSRAAELGVEKVIEDSSGNAGAAIATYAARAGLDADIYVPADVKQSKLMTIQQADARPIRIEGSRQDVTDACIDAVAGEADDSNDGAPSQTGEGWYASHAWNPAFYAGTMTFAFEVAAQRAWTAPDAVVLPLGHGTLFLGSYLGFSRLSEAGIVDELPRLLGAQAEGYAPIVEALGGNGGLEQTDVADGIQITEPARMDDVLAAIDGTDGDAIALDDDEIEATLDRLHRNGFYVEPTSAVAPAALDRYRETGVLEGDDDVVVPLTGSGLKAL